MPSELIAKVAPPRALADYTRQELLIPQVRDGDSAGIISELSHALQREGVVPDVLPFYHAALNRELLATSALDCGIAFPHARMAGIKRLQFALGRAAKPIGWNGKNSRSVGLVFLLAVPATDATGYLQLMAGLARLVRQPELLAQLFRAETPNAMLETLNQIKIRSA